MKTQRSLPKRNTGSPLCISGLTIILASSALAVGPYPPTDWPPTLDPTKRIHYGSIDGAFAAPTTNSVPTLSIVGLGAPADQGTVLTPCLGGYTGEKAAYTYFNIADTSFFEWANVSNIDILLQVYGDSSVLNPTNYTMARKVRFQEGTSASGYSTYVSPSVQSYATNANNFQWNWILFSVTNNSWSNQIDHLIYRQVGSIKPASTGNTNNGGINGGTLRMQCSDNNAGMVGWTVHAMAIGELGAFGTIADMNLFSPPGGPACPAVPAANLVGLDFNLGTSNYLQVMDQADTTIMYTNGIGPGGDLRACIYPTSPNGTGGYLYNFAVVSNYLGLPCNNNEAWKVCLDFYDDPAFAGAVPAVQFGPEAFAIDGQGCSSPSIYPSTSLATLSGSGQWIRRSWIVGGGTGVNLYGVNVQPLTGGPRLICKNQPVAISRVDMAILRTGTEPLAGQDPLAGCALDPVACQGVYSNFVELDLANGITNGLDIGTLGSDQGFITETAGPTNDVRLSVRPGFGDSGIPGPYLQFQILNSELGPSYQDNSHLAIVVTYYDDPALTNQSFGIDAWKFHNLAAENIFAADAGKWITLEGTGKWRDAYWEIDKIDFNGVNQAPQAAVRFKCTERIHVCHVRYSVIRPCGPNAGQNALDNYRVTSLSAMPDTNGLLRLTWPYQEPQLTVQGCAGLGSSWSLFQGTPIPAEGGNAVLRLSPTNSSQMFRLYRPSIP